MYSPADLAALTDEQLVGELRSCADRRREIDALAAQLAGEIKTRSSHEQGYSGLAQSKGARTAEILVQQTTGLSRTESNALVRVGSKPDYLAPISTEALGVAKVDAVRAGLGAPAEHVSADDLLQAAVRVAEEARELTVEQAAAHARAIRDELDGANVGRREQEQRDARYLTIHTRADGMFPVYGLLDPESAMVLTTATDAIIAPRRGGPRFVDKEQAAEQERLAAEDQRTIGQMMVDALVDLVLIATRTPEGAVLTGGKGSVSLHTLKTTIDTGVGVGYFEGHPDAVSFATVQRFSCDLECVYVDFDRGFAIDVGRDQRLFTRKQRIAIYARDGGCMFPGCDRPPKWTEVHHINEWVADNGLTDTADGILLCRHHHMLLHNNHWTITRTGTVYFLHAPDGTITQLQSKSPLYRQHGGGLLQPSRPPGPESIPDLRPTG
jgi:hypothetical protein